MAIGWIATGAVSAQGGSGGVTSRTTGSVTWSAGDLMVVSFGCEDSGSISSVTDSVHGTTTGWTIDTLVDGSGPRAQMAYKVATTGGTGTVTVNCSSAPWAEASVVIGGPPAASPYDVRATNTGSSSSPSTGTTATLAQADTWLVATLKVYNNVNFSAWTNSFTERIDGVGLGVAERTVAATTGTGTQATSTVNDAWAGVVLAFSGATSGTEYTQSASGTATSAGALVKQAGKVTAGTVTSAGALIKQAGKVVAGTAAAAGALVRQTARALTGAAASTGALLKETARALTGAVTSAGTLAGVKTVLVSLTGAIASAGSLVRQTGKVLDGAVASAGTVAKLTARALTGALTTSGALVRLIGKGLAGVLSLAGSAAGVASEGSTPSPGGGTTTNPLSLASTTARGGTTTAARTTTSTTSTTRRTSTAAGD